MISGKATATGFSVLSVSVSDSEGLTTAGVVVIGVVPPTVALAVTTKSPLPAGVVGEVYSQSLAATGGTPPYKWALSTGTMPAGLTLSGTGVISGTPTAAGSAQLKLQVTDSATVSTAASLTLDITGAL